MRNLAAPLYVLLVWLAGSVTSLAGAVELTVVDRHTVIEEAAKHDELLVYFYATWCALCSSFEPVFNSFAETYGSEGTLGFAKFDGGADRAYAGRVVADVYPSVALWRKGKFYLHARSQLNKKDMEKWIQQYTGDTVELYENEADARKRAVNFRTTFVAAIANDNDLEVLRNFVYDHRHFGKFVAFRDSSISKSKLAVKHQGEKEKIGEWSDEEELMGFADEARFPLLGPVDESNQHLYYLRGKDPVMVFGTAKEVKPLANTIRGLALKNPEVSFMWFDTREEGALRQAKSHGVYEYPGFVTWIGSQGPARDRKKFVFSGKSSDLDEVEDWIKQVRDGKIRPNVESSWRKPTDRKFDSDVVTWVQGDKFEEQVFHDDADYLLLLTAPRGTELFPGCMQCENTLKALDQLIKKILPKDAPLKIGELMVTSNEIPLRGWGGSWEIQTLPTIYFIPAGQRETFNEWPRVPADIRSILTRWEEETIQFKSQAAAIRQTLLDMEGPIDTEVQQAEDKAVDKKKNNSATQKTSSEETTTPEAAAESPQQPPDGTNTSSTTEEEGGEEDTPRDEL